MLSTLRRVVVGLLISMFGLTVVFASRPLSFEERVKAQEAIERVYYEHQLWPKENPGPKPPFEKVVTRALLEAKVTETLKKSEALDQFWQRPIVSSQLQAEMERMARGTKDPATLLQLFAALDNDPMLIAECLARPVLVDRLIRNWYAYDTRFHGEARLAAENAQLGLTADNFSASPTGIKAEQLYLLTGKEKGQLRDKLERLGARAKETEVAAEEFARLAGDSPAPGRIAFRETQEAFILTLCRAKTAERLELEVLSFPKKGFTTWWQETQEKIQPERGVILTGHYSLPDVAFAECAEEWTVGNLAGGVQTARDSHTAVWTGTEMIVWGGWSTINTGGRYNPATDSWVATSTGANCPTGRYNHTAVWTGTEMIIWGGYGGGFLNTGGRYNPTTDSWVATSTDANCPTARHYHTALWTGTEMIVWGGYDGITWLNTGGRYNPATDTWVATSTGANWPTGRYNHTAVWTGSEMIVWGGWGGVYQNTGGKYTPATDSWVATSIDANCPTGRYYHTAVWTGTQMVVWGGYWYDGTYHYENTGGKYNPATDSWVATSTGTNCPAGRGYHTATWTGSEMIVWGGYWDDGVYEYFENTGGRYNVATGSWTPTSIGTNCPSGRVFHTAVWTGAGMLIWGGYDATYASLGDGALLQPYPAIQSFQACLPTTLYAGSGSSYQWYRDGVALSGATASSYLATLQGSYTVTIDYSGVCTKTSPPFLVSATPTPSVVASSPDSCNAVTLTTGVFSSYQWFRNGVALDGATARNYKAWQSGTYTVRVANSGGCQGTSSGKTLTITPSFTPVVSGGSVGCDGTGVTLSTGTYNAYQWYQDGILIPGATGATHTAAAPGLYSVLATTAGGCMAFSAGKAVTMQARPAPFVGTGVSELWGTNGGVFSTVVSGNTLYVGGAFTKVGANTGSLGVFQGGASTPDSGWPTVAGVVFSIVGDGAGGWYIGGSFKSVGGYGIQGVARIRADKTVDTSFSPQTDGPVYTLLLSGETLHLGGQFGTVGGLARQNLAAVATATGAVRAWNPGTDNTVWALSIGGTWIYVGGDFTMLGGQPRSALAAVDTLSGVVAPWDPNPVDANESFGVPAHVEAIAVFDGSVFFGGSFTTVGGVPRLHVAAVDALSGSPMPWDPGTDQWGWVYALALSGNTMYIGGYFSEMGGLGRHRLAAVDAVSGAVHPWAPWVYMIEASSQEYVDTIAIDGGVVYALGYFDVANGVGRAGLAALDPATGVVLPWDPSPGPLALAIAPAGASIAVGGAFSFFGGIPRDNLAAFDLTTGQPTAWDPSARSTSYNNWGSYPHAPVNTMVLSGSTLYLGGTLTSVGGESRRGLAAMDVTSGAVLPWAPELVDYWGDTGSAIALAVTGTTVYVGGYFDTVNYEPRFNLAAVHAETGALLPWNPDANSDVHALVVSGGTIYTSGRFTTIGGQSRRRIAALDLATGTPTAWDPNANSLVYALALSGTGTTVYAGGRFTTIGGQSRNHIAALDTTTGAATAWNPNADGTVHCVVSEGDTVYAGGFFGTIGGLPFDGVAALDASTGLTNDWDMALALTGINARTYSINVDGDRIIAAGLLSAALGEPAGGIALLPGSTMTSCSNALSTGSFASYQWLRDGMPIAGATGQNYTAVQSGSYSVLVTGNMGCSAISPVRMITGQLSPVVSGLGELCPGDTSYLSTGSFASYQWRSAPLGMEHALKLEGTVAAPGGSYYYDILASPAYTIQAGDALEYWIHIANTSPQAMAGVDLVASGWNLRGSGATDQTGISAHPSANLASRASGQWYRRIIPIPASGVGKVLSGTGRGVFLALEGDTVGSYAVYAAGIKITRNGVAQIVIHDGLGAFTFPGDAGYSISAGYSGVVDSVALGGANIPGATEQNLATQQSGSYSVAVMSQDGCLRTSSTYAVAVLTGPGNSLMGTKTGTETANLSWAVCDGAIGYQVLVNRTPQSAPQSFEWLGDSILAAYADTSTIAPGQVFWYKVESTNGSCILP